MDNLTKFDTLSQETPLAKEHARRTYKRRRKTPHFFRLFFLAILVILIFMAAYTAASHIIRSIKTATADTQVIEEDDILLRLNEQSQQIQQMQSTINQLTEQLEKYNKQYGPLDGADPPSPMEPFSENAGSSNRETASDTSASSAVEEIF